MRRLRISGRRTQNWHRPGIGQRSNINNFAADSARPDGEGKEEKRSADHLQKLIKMRLKHFKTSEIALPL
jgi:hypothetical protein